MLRFDGGQVDGARHRLHRLLEISFEAFLEMTEILFWINISEQYQIYRLVKSPGDVLRFEGLHVQNVTSGGVVVVVEVYAHLGNAKYFNKRSHIK